jgi:hypothetical protein
MKDAYLIKLLKIYFCLSLSIFLLTGAKHPFFISVTNIQHDVKSKSLKISCKLFTNDIEEALRKITKTKIDLINGQNKAELNKYMETYLKTHLSLKANSKSLIFTLIGFEHESDVVWCYLESKNVPTLKTLQIDNSILYDFIKEQTNICEVEVGKQTKSSKVSNPEKRMEFLF